MALKRRRSFKFRLGDGNCSISQKVGHPAFFFNYMLFLFWVTIGRQSGLYRSTYCKVLCLRVFHLGTCVPLRVVLPVQWHLPASRTSIPGQCCHYLELFPTIGWFPKYFVSQEHWDLYKASMLGAAARSCRLNCSTLKGLQTASCQCSCLKATKP